MKSAILRGMNHHAKTEYQVAFIMSLWQQTEKETAQLIELQKQQTIDWNLVLQTILFNEVAPVVYINIEKQQFLNVIPVDELARLAASLEPVYLKVKKKNAGRRAGATKVFKLFNDNNIEFAGIKGFMLSDELYGEASYKKMNDVDLLVREEQVPRIISLFKENGYKGLKEMVSSEECSTKVMGHQLPMYFNHDFTCMISVQWGLISNLTNSKPVIADVWHDVVPAVIADQNAKRMSWSMNLVHIAIDMPFFKVGIREINDPINILRLRAAEIDWNEIADLGKRWKCQDHLYRMFSLCNQFYPGLVPEQYLRRWEAKAFSYTKLDTSYRQQQADTNFVVRTNYLSEVDRFCVSFFMTEDFKTRVSLYYKLMKYIHVISSKDAKKLAPYSKTPIIRNLRACIAAYHGFFRNYGWLSMPIFHVMAMYALMKFFLGLMSKRKDNSAYVKLNKLMAQME